MPRGDTLKCAVCGYEWPQKFDSLPSKCANTGRGTGLARCESRRWETGKKRRPSKLANRQNADRDYRFSEDSRSDFRAGFRFYGPRMEISERAWERMSDSKLHAFAAGLVSGEKIDGKELVAALKDARGDPSRRGSGSGT